MVVLATGFKLNAFIALSLASLFMGLAAGMEPAAAARVFSAGVGEVLGSVALVIGLGMVLGKLAVESGASARIAWTLVHAFGPERAHWTMGLVGLVVGLPVFFTVGLVVLIPIVTTAARQIRVPLLRLGLPLVAGLSVAHGLVPPHPGPLAAVEILRADIGRTLLYAVLVAVPTALLCGPILGTFLARHEPSDLEKPNRDLTPYSTPARAPGFTLSLVSLLLPVLLMLASTVVALALPQAMGLRRLTDLLGHPVVAMLVAVVFSLWSLGIARGFRRHELLAFSEQSLAPAAQLLLVIGAGGGFSKILSQSGVGNALAALAVGVHFSPLALGWLLAVAIRVATGSATVAVSTAAGILAPIASSNTGLNPALLVVAMGAGSLAFSHVNDGGFWLVKEYFDLSVSKTLRTWTVVETAISLVALLFTLLLSRFV